MNYTQLQVITIKLYTMKPKTDELVKKVLFFTWTFVIIVEIIFWIL